jgi:hypothetical protein
LHAVPAELERAAIGDGMFNTVVGDIHRTAADTELVTGLEDAADTVAIFIELL